MASRDVNIRIKIDPDRQGAQQAERSLSGIGREALRANTPLQSVVERFRGMKPAALAAAAGIGALVIGVGGAVAVLRKLSSVVQGVVRDIFEIGSRFQTLRVQLETATGSLGAANAQFERIKDFASTTPFEVGNITEAFVRLRNVGITPTNDDLEAFGNIAAANTRDITDFSEAVIGAITGEMERLKQFGIVARQENDKVRFIFRGTETEVAKNTEAIVSHLIKIGKTEFAGGMERQAQTLDGALSNLTDSWEATTDTIAQRSGVLTAAESVIRQISEALGASTEDIGTFSEVAADQMLVAMEAASLSVAKFLDILADLGLRVENVSKAILFLAGITQPAVEALKKLAEGVIELEGTGESETAVRQFFEKLKKDIDKARDAAANAAGEMTEFGGATDRAGESASKAAKKADDLRQKISDLKLKIAATNTRAWADAIDDVSDALGGMDIIEIQEWLEDQGRVIPETTLEWKELAEAIREVDEALQKVTSTPDQIPLDVEGELGGAVGNSEVPWDFEGIFREGEEKFGQLAKEAEAVMTRAWENIQDVAADAIGEILKTGEVDFKKLANAVLDIFAQMLAKLLVMWAANAAERAALEQGVSAVSGGNGGGGNNGFSGSSMLSIAKAAWPLFAVAAGWIIGQAKVASTKSKQTGGTVHFGTPTNMGVSFNEVEGMSEQMLSVLETLQETFADIEHATGASIGILEQAVINVKNNGDIWVNIGERLSVQVADMNEAMGLVVNQLLRTSEIVGGSDAIRAALENSSELSVEGLQENIAAALRSEELFLGVEGRSAIRDQTREFFELLQKEIELGLIEAQGGSGALRGLVASYQENFERLMGIQRDAGEVARQQARAHNAALKMDKARLLAMRADIAAKGADAKATAAAAGAAGGHADIMVRQAEVTQGAAQAHAGLSEVVAAEGEITAVVAQSNAEALSATAQALAAIDEALAALDGLEVDLDAAAAAARRAARGGGGRVRADRERVQGFLREHELSQLSDLARAHAELATQREELIEAAHGDAEAIKALNEAIDEQIRAANQAAVEDVYGRLTDFEQDPTLSPFRQGLQQVGETASEIREDFLQLAEDLEFGSERIAKGLARIEAAERARLQALVEQEGQDLLLAALQFLGRSEEAERLQFELSKAELQIRFQELRIAVQKHNLELEMLGRIGDLVGEIGELDFEEWQRLRRPVQSVNRNLGNTNRELERMADRLANAKDGIRDFLNSLDRNEFGGLSPEDALENALAQFEEIRAAAQAGDINALEAFPEASRNLLELAREFFASGPQFAEIFEMVRQAGIDLLGVNQAREGNVIFDERFFNAQQQQVQQQQQTNATLEEIRDALQEQNARSSQVA